MKDENTDFERLPYVAAFLQSARGNRDDLPTHYPRTDPHPNPAGENFKWFGRNESGQKLALPGILDDGGLPLNPD